MPGKADYKLVFEGKTVAGVSVETVKRNLAQRLKLDRKKIHALFSGKRIVIKQRVALHTANQFKAAFRRAGVVLTIEPMEPTASPSPENVHVAGLSSENRESDFLHPVPTGRKTVITAAAVIFGAFVLVLLGIGGYQFWQKRNETDRIKRVAATHAKKKQTFSENQVPGLPHIGQSEPVTSEAEFNRVVEEINRLQAQAVGFLKESNYQAVVPIYEGVLKTIIKKFGKDHPAVPGAMNDLAFVLARQSELKRAEILFSEAIKACRAAGKNEDLQVAVASEELARIYLQQGRLNEIDPLYQQAVRVWDRISGPDNVTSLELKMKRADLLERLGQNNDAEQIRRKVDKALERLERKTTTPVQTATSGLPPPIIAGPDTVLQDTQPKMEEAAKINISIAVDFTPVIMEVPAKSGGPAKLTEKPPDEITQKPAFIGTRQRYGKLTLGTHSEKTYCFVLDIPPETSPLLYFDKNRNGNLADDGPPLQNKGPGVFATSVTIPIRQMIQEYRRNGNFHIWIHTMNWPEPTFHHYSRTQMKGQIYLNGKTYLAYVAERGDNDADFTNDGIYIDLDQNGKINPRSEWIGSDEKNIIDGKTYRFDVQW